MNRRGFITGLASLVAAPAIVKAASLMPVRGIVMAADYGYSPAMYAIGSLVEYDRAMWQCRWTEVAKLIYPAHRVTE